MKALTRRLYSAAGGSRRGGRSTSPPRKRGDTGSGTDDEGVLGGGSGGSGGVRDYHNSGELSDDDVLARALASHELERMTHLDDAASGRVGGGGGGTSGGGAHGHRGAWQSQYPYDGGRGGGRADMAQAGGSDVAALPAALASVEGWVRERL